MNEAGMEIYKSGAATSLQGTQRTQPSSVFVPSRYHTYTTLTVVKMFGSVVVKVSVEGKADCSFEGNWTIGEALVYIQDRYGLIGGTIESMNGSEWVACRQVLSFISIIQALLELNVPCQFRFTHFQTIEQLPQQQAGKRFIVPRLTLSRSLSDSIFDLSPRPLASLEFDFKGSIA
jgi:hypothetical protein